MVFCIWHLNSESVGDLCFTIKTVFEIPGLYLGLSLSEPLSIGVYVWMHMYGCVWKGWQESFIDDPKTLLYHAKLRRMWFFFKKMIIILPYSLLSQISSGASGIAITIYLFGMT